MKYILTGGEMAQADRATSEKIGIPSLVLMERAALSVADEVSRRHPASSRISIVCGPGNNGADGIAAGRILTDRGYCVQFLLLNANPPAEGSSMAVQQSVLSAYGIEPQAFSEKALLGFAPAVVIDAMFGTGLSKPLTGTAADACRAMDRCRADLGAAVVGLDLPSGISADTGEVLGAAPHCDYTVTFAFLKRGHLLFPGSDYCGEVLLREIGITQRALACEPGLVMQEKDDIAALLPVRQRDGNKGTFGRITVIAGTFNMCGAAVLCAEAVLRCGAGMVRVVTREENRQIVQERLPEALLTTYREEDGDLPAKLREALLWGDTAVVGPGLGRSWTAVSIVREVLACIAEGSAEPVPLRGLVLDADALRIVAADPSLAELLRNHRPETSCILTPHPGEFADLAGIPIDEYLAERPRLLSEMAASCRCAVIGKDARTMTAGFNGEPLSLTVLGNSGMGTAGSGDVLTGAAAALLSAFTRVRKDRDGSDPAYNAAVSAAFVHACAGDLAAQLQGEHAVIASDICRSLGGALMDITGGRRKLYERN